MTANRVVAAVPAIYGVAVRGGEATNSDWIDMAAHTLRFECQAVYNLNNLSHNAEATVAMQFRQGVRTDGLYIIRS